MHSGLIFMFSFVVFSRCCLLHCRINNLFLCAWQFYCQSVLLCFMFLLTSLIYVNLTIKGGAVQWDVTCTMSTVGFAPPHHLSRCLLYLRLTVVWCFLLVFYPLPNCQSHYFCFSFPPANLLLGLPAAVEDISHGINIFLSSCFEL